LLWVWGPYFEGRHIGKLIIGIYAHFWFYILNQIRTQTIPNTLYTTLFNFFECKRIRVIYIYMLLVWFVASVPLLKLMAQVADTWNIYKPNWYAIYIYYYYYYYYYVVIVRASISFAHLILGLIHLLQCMRINITMIIIPYLIWKNYIMKATQINKKITILRETIVFY